MGPFLRFYLTVFVLSVSLQDINMRKAFKSSTTQDQQVVSKSSVPNPVKEMYNLSDKPPPLTILTPYRSAFSTLNSDILLAVYTKIYHISTTSPDSELNGA